MGRPLHATIDLAAFRHNYLLARRLAGPGRTTLAVVKADAYGHGMIQCARAIADVADGFALLEVSEARRLRQAGITQPVVLLEGFFSPGELEEVDQLRLCPVIHAWHQIEALALSRPIKPIPVFLKVNTGMNRLGFMPAEVSSALARLEGMASVDEVVLMTHFADADGDAGIAAQLACFRALPGWQRQRISLANSAALLRFGQDAGDVVRPGIMLYGASPMAALASAADLGLKPVMTLASELIAVQELLPGAAIGYGATFVADRPLRVGVVACGYADGYPRHAPTGTPILVGGVRTITLGRVSMDMLACDITDLPGATVGSPVVLWGKGLSADDVAIAAGTISYELFCARAPRVPVSWIDPGGED
ncbi:MAG: alanine racemase [Rhodocyclaceae bacterium]|jgi:alanine racemase|nr:alanine racemase [Rhodocyclaceae bacterium]